LCRVELDLQIFTPACLGPPVRGLLGHGRVAGQVNDDWLLRRRGQGRGQNNEGWSENFDAIHPVRLSFGLRRAHNRVSESKPKGRFASFTFFFFLLTFASQMETADEVIIGSGIVGSSVAYHLAQNGCTNVVVLEREAHQGKGSTGKSMGGVRAQFATPVNIQMSKYSIDFFSKFDEVVGHPGDYRAHGYLFCATNEKHLAYLKANKERQNALGVTNVEWVAAEDIVKMVPQLRVDDILGGTFCPTDGFVDPHSVMMGFMLNAREKGVRLWLD